MDGPVEPEGFSADVEFLVELVTAKVTTIALDEMSAVLSGVAVLKGRLVSAVCRAVELPPATFLTEHGHFESHFYPDSSQVKLVEGSKILYLPFKLDYIYKLDGSRDPSVFCLILEEQSHTPGCHVRYRRLGHFYFTGKEKIYSFCFGKVVDTIEII